MIWLVRIISVFTLILVIIKLQGCSKSTDSMEYKLVWQDNFNGSAGQLPDAAKWGFDIGTDWGNAQLEYDTNRPENVSLDGNGNLVITARKETYVNRQYTSGRIVTRDRYEFTYGRVEARIKLPVGQGIWPAFWMLGSNISSVGWPQCGEIDIMEYRGQQPNTVASSVHGPGYSGGNALSRSFTLEGSDFNSDFHLFAVEWNKNKIDFYVDDAYVLSVIPSHVNGNEWVFDHPFYLILNVAVGGNYVGAPDSSTIFPQTMLVDYVKVYQGE